MNGYLECVIETNPDALDIARRLDAERKQGKVRGPLHGIPVLVKDVSVDGQRRAMLSSSFHLCCRLHLAVISSLHVSISL